MRAVRLTAICMLLAYVLAGCGGSGATSGNYAASGSNATTVPISTPSVSHTGTVVLDFGTGTKAQAGSAYKVLGADANGQVIYGPMTFPAAPTITLAQVPVAVRSLLLVSVNGSTAVDAIAKNVTITPGSTLTLSDPLSTFDAIRSIAVTPASSTLQAAGSQQLKATATYPDDVRYELTSLVAWATSNAAVASVEATGLATGVSGGTCTASASLGGVTGTATLIVPAAPTTTTVTSSMNPSVAGVTLIFTATVAHATAGTVAFLDGATSLGTASISNGQATLSTAALTAGTHTITASYAASTAFAGSSASMSQIVYPPAGVTLGSSANPAVFGQPVVFTVVVSNDKGGGVTFLDGATALATNVPVVNGQAAFTTSSLALGTHTMTAAYTGPSGPATSLALPQLVNTATTTTTLQSSAMPADTLTALTFTASVNATAPGGGTPAGTVTFFDGATNLGAATLANGQATLQTSTLRAGTHSITAAYAGTPNRQASTSNALSQVMIGYLYAAGRGTYAVYKFAPDATRTTYGAGFEVPAGLVFDSAGNLFVTEVNSGLIKKVGPGGSPITTFGTVVDSPRHATVDPFDNIYVASRNSNCVFKFTPAGASTVYASINGAFAPAYAPDGTMYVTQGGPLVFEVSPGGVVTTFASNLSQTSAIIADSAGNVYLARANTGTVTRFVNGVPSTYASGVGNPMGLAFDNDGNLYVASDDVIFKVTPQGTVTTFATGMGTIEQLQFR